jgi:hypothetical protein
MSGKGHGAGSSPREKFSERNLVKIDEDLSIHS